jgi:hypothetical protein
VIGGGAIAGVGFTVSLLIATLAFSGVELQEAKLGVLSAALCASALTWAVFRVTRMLPRQAKLRALVGTAQTIVDLAVPVDVERDHLRGPSDASVMRSRSSASCWRASAISVTSGGICR